MKFAALQFFASTRMVLGVVTFACYCGRRHLVHYLPLANAILLEPVPMYSSSAIFSKPDIQVGIPHTIAKHDHKLQYFPLAIPLK